jgi:hypothetical protein
VTDDERRRALDSLIQIGGRMRYLALLCTRPSPDWAKLSGELEGMAAWVVAFARVIAGQPSGVLEGEPAPLELVSVQVAHVVHGGQHCAVATARWPAEGLEVESEPLDGDDVAMAQALMRLGRLFVDETNRKLAALPELNAHGMPPEGD